MTSVGINRDFSNPKPVLSGLSLMITGGTGSFGQALVKKLLTEFDARKIIVFSRDELKQSQMAEEFSADAHPNIRFFIGDVRDQSRLELAMRDVDYVVHAAAMKQVPAAEYNPIECINTNVYGAENIVRAALRTNVSKIIALSTDKATNPINLYGASKLAADKIFVAANNLSGREGPKFSVVRYGNVLGSRGSVVELYKKLIEQGVGQIPITDIRMTRFWIAIEQGVDFVLSCLNVMDGGETFVPKIPSMKIIDVASAIAPGLPHEVIGIRAGEKLHELMISADDAQLTLEYQDRYVILPPGRGNISGSVLGEAQTVSDRFEYSSNGNTEWLDPEDLNKMISAMGVLRQNI